jgi:GTP-binding protein HflX
VPQIEIYNKIDMIDAAEPRVDYDKHGQVSRIWCSAKTGAGIEELKAVLLTQMQTAGFAHAGSSHQSEESGTYEQDSVEQVG